MGIYRKYDLTAYAYQMDAPDTYYSVDFYRIEIYGNYEGEYLEINCEDWEDATKKFAKLCENQPYGEDTRVTLYGIVVD